MSGKLLEVAKAPIAPEGSGVGNRAWSFKHSLQLEREKAKLARERFQFDLEQEKLKAAAALEREQVNLGWLGLALMREDRNEAAVVHRDFDVACLHLLPKCDEKDPDTFFTLFGQVAGVRGWSDVHWTLMLQCIFTGKAQRTFFALSLSESASYGKVKAAVLKAYELVPKT